MELVDVDPETFCEKRCRKDRSAQSASRPSTGAPEVARDAEDRPAEQRTGCPERDDRMACREAANLRGDVVADELKRAHGEPGGRGAPAGRHARSERERRHEPGGGGVDERVERTVEVRLADRGEAADRKPDDDDEQHADTPAREGRRSYPWRGAKRHLRKRTVEPASHGAGLSPGTYPYTERVKRVALLGATGSIGRQAIEIVAAHPGLELCAAASGSTPLDGVDAPLKQVGGDLTELLELAQPDVVLNAVVGFAGIHATLWALERGIDLALANKESLVAGGDLALDALNRGGGRILPVDSEHSALSQCLEGRDREQVDSLVLTGSGGPFRGRTREDLADVTPAQALAHPTWSMGPKITIDSATLANKGLELIEAHFLFGIPYRRIEVVIQPTSIVHSLVRFRDGALLAHLGMPDMRAPISYALTYPERAATPVTPLDFSTLTLEFAQPDTETFPMLALAREAGEKGGTAPAVFNAANEVAVAAFLAGRLPFLAIAEVVADALAQSDGAPARDVQDLLEADGAARRHAEQGLSVA
jgi:1-deoxy-D-xylulose-5-phosphate reductoisomerase